MAVTLWYLIENFQKSLNTVQNYNTVAFHNRSKKLHYTLKNH